MDVRLASMTVEGSAPPPDDEAGREIDDDGADDGLGALFDLLR
jgi:hypothetical protein